MVAVTHLLVVGCFLLGPCPVNILNKSEKYEYIYIIL